MALWGVSDALLAQATRELLLEEAASNEPAEASATSLLPPSPSPASLVSADLTKSAGRTPSTAPPKPGPKRQASGHPEKMVPIKIRLAHGKATNIAIPFSFFERVREKFGDEASAREWLRGIAISAPEKVGNRSKWTLTSAAEQLAQQALL